VTASRVLVYVQHLLGTGHLKRAALLVDALTRAGQNVTLVSGGFPVPGLPINAARFVQLPPVGAADMTFKSLVDERGQPVDDGFRQRRRDILLAVWQDARPQLLLVELFPFGRRQMRFELLPLLEAARSSAHPPVIVSSVRDVLGGQADPERHQRMLDLFNRYFDHVLVHGDPALVPFERTFTYAQQLGQRLHYTGYVVDRAFEPAPGAPDDTTGRDEVIVSAGGGAVGAPVLEAAIRARPLSTLTDVRWRVLVGAGIGERQFAQLVALAQELNSDGVVVERNRPDFTALLRRCRLSISQAGYNTVLETLQAGARCVLVPFAGASETEQTLRARILAERGWIDMVQEDGLTARALAHVVDRAAARSTRAQHALRLDGADTSARLMLQWLQQSAP